MKPYYLWRTNEKVIGDSEVETASFRIKLYHILSIRKKCQSVMQNSTEYYFIIRKSKENAVIIYYGI